MNFGAVPINKVLPIESWKIFLATNNEQIAATFL